MRGQMVAEFERYSKIEVRVGNGHDSESAWMSTKICVAARRENWSEWIYAFVASCNHPQRHVGKLMARLGGYFLADQPLHVIQLASPQSTSVRHPQRVQAVRDCERSGRRKAFSMFLLSHLLKAR